MFSAIQHAATDSRERNLAVYNSYRKDLLQSEMLLSLIKFWALHNPQEICRIPCKMLRTYNFSSKRILLLNVDDISLFKKKKRKTSLMYHPSLIK